jgi:hypothetical protein
MGYLRSQAMEEKNMIEMRGAADFFAVSLSNFKMNYKKWGVPYHRFGKSVRFSMNELYSWLESRDHQDVNGDGDEDIG